MALVTKKQIESADKVSAFDKNPNMAWSDNGLRMLNDLASFEKGAIGEESPIEIQFGYVLPSGKVVNQRFHVDIDEFIFLRDKVNGYVVDEMTTR